MKMNIYLVKVRDWYSDEVDRVTVRAMDPKRAALAAMEKSHIYWAYVEDDDEDVMLLA